MSGSFRTHGDDSTSARPHGTKAAVLLRESPLKGTKAQSPVPFRGLILSSTGLLVPCGRAGTAESSVSENLPIRVSQNLRTAEPADGILRVALRPYQLRAFALRLESPPLRLDPPRARPLDLPSNADGISRDHDRTDGDFDGSGHTLAGELLPATVVREGIPFRTGEQRTGRANVLIPRGQRLSLPPGDFDRLYLLAAAVDGGRKAAFAIDGELVELWVQDYATPVGQWDSRLSGGVVYHRPDAVTPGYVNRAEVGWVGTHRHGPAGENEPYVFTYLFKYGLGIPRGAGTLTLPDDPNLRILAITAAHNPNDVARPARPLYDRYDETTVEILAERRAFLDAVEVTLRSPNPDPVIRYTLDGTDPTPASPVFREPFTLTEGTTVKARAFAPGMESRHVARAEFVALTARAPASVAAVRPGLRCRYYQGEWERLPGFGPLEPLRTDVVDRVAVPEFARAEEFGLEWSDLLEVPRRGVYRLHLRSDDGSALWLGGERVIDNDGIHGEVEASVDVPLDPGMHRIRLEYFQRRGDLALELRWEGPGIALQPVPPEVLFRQEFDNPPGSGSGRVQ